MKKFNYCFYLVGVALLGLLLAACGGGKEETDGQKTTSSGFVCPQPQHELELTSTEVNLFVWTEYIPNDIIECFELVYGIKVNRDEFSSMEEMYAKLSAGGSAYDVIHITDYIVELTIRQGLLQKLDHNRLPVLTDFDPNYLNLPYDPNNEYTMPYQAGTDAIVINTEKVENLPASWEDLWKPEYAGRIVSIDDSRAIIGLTLLTLGYSPNTTDPAQLTEAKNKLAQLVPNIRLFDSDSPKTALIAGEVDLGIVWTAEAVLAQRENPAIQYIYPSEGAILWLDNYAIPTEAPHLDAAYAWLNYTMQNDLFWLMLQDFPYTNPSKASLDYAKTNQPDLYNAYMNSIITNVPTDAIQKGHYIEDVGESTPIYDQIWIEVKGE